MTRSLDQMTWGRTGKAVKAGVSSPETGPGGIMPITLNANADMTGKTGDIQMCDTWDAPASASTAYRGVTNTLNIAEEIRVSASPTRVLIGQNNFWVGESSFTKVPSDIYRIEYRNSPESWQGTNYISGTEARCGATDGWFDTVEAAGGADAVNTMRVVIDRVALRAWMTELGLEGVEAWTPQLRVDFSMVAPPRDALNPDTTNYAHDAFALMGGSDGSTTPKFNQGGSYRVQDSYLRYAATKFVAAAGQSSTNRSVSVTPGSEVTFTLLPGAWAAPNYYSFNHFLPQPGDTQDYQLTYTDSLPKCADTTDNPPFTVVGPTTGLSWEYIPPVGDPCHGDGTPAQVIWTLDAHRTSETDTVVRPPQLRYNVTMRSDVLPGTNNPAPMMLKIDPVGQEMSDQSFPYQAHHDMASVYTSPGPAEVGSSKAVDSELVRTGERVGWTVTLMNKGSGEATKTEWIDVLPFVGDARVRGTETLHTDLPSAVDPGVGALSEVQVDSGVWSSTIPTIPAPTDNQLTIWYTTADPATIVQDPNDPSNLPGGATNWCLPEQALCDTANATAIKLSVDKMRAFSQVEVHFTASTQDLMHGSVLYNQLSVGRTEGLTLPVPLVAPVRTEVYDLLIDGVVWFDDNRDGIRDADELLLEDAEVHLLNADGSPYLAGGQPVITNTDAAGYYWFGQGLRPDGSQPAATAGAGYEPLFLPDGAYRTAVVRNGVVLATWAVTCSGGNTELPGVCVGGNPALDGTSLDLDLGGTARTLPIEFTLYQKADFGLMSFPNAELPFTGGQHNELGMMLGGFFLLGAVGTAWGRQRSARK